MKRKILVFSDLPMKYVEGNEGISIEVIKSAEQKQWLDTDTRESILGIVTYAGYKLNKYSKTLIRGLPETNKDSLTVEDVGKFSNKVKKYYLDVDDLITLKKQENSIRKVRAQIYLTSNAKYALQYLIWFTKVDIPELYDIKFMLNYNFKYNAEGEFLTANSFTGTLTEIRIYLVKYNLESDSVELLQILEDTQLK